MPDQPSAADVAAFAVERTGRARIVLRGASMAPTLRAGMVADVERVDNQPRAGDILVFRGPAGLIAHRFIVRRGDSFVTCGDATPNRLETFGPQALVGRIRTVWSGAGPDARRLDGRLSRTRVNLMLRSHGVRASVREARGAARRFAAYARPRLSTLRKRSSAIAEPPAFAQLVAASAAFESGDAQGGVAALRSVPLEALVAVAIRHQMGGLVSRWLEAAAAAGSDVPRDLREPFTQARFASALQAEHAVKRLRAVVSLLREQNIEPIVLKGGARLARADADAQLHYAGDIDVLVPPSDADRATAALLAAGYVQNVPSDRKAFFARRHQHRAPLSVPGERVPVEVHVALSTPRSVTQPFDYASLLPNSVTVDGPAGPVRVLDRVYSALHLAYHGHDLRVWRDIVLLSRLLRELTPAERAEFERVAAAERRDRVRLRSSIAAADALAGAPLELEPHVRRYLGWSIAREDFPVVLRRRCHIVEGLVAHNPRHFLGWRESLRQVRSWIYNAVFTVPVLRYWYWSRNSRVPPLAILGLEPRRPTP